MSARRPSARALALLLAAALAGAALSGCGIQSADDYVTALPGQPAAVVAGDFDGDGLEDVMIGYGSDYFGITEVQQDGYGVWTRHDLGTLVFGSELMAVTDLDDDGASDMIAAARGLDRFNVLRNRGDGTFTNSVKVLAPSSPDGDTHISVLASATAPSGKRLVAVAFSTEDPGAITPRGVTVYEASGGDLTATNPFQLYEVVPGDATALQLHDLDGDGRLDLLVGTVDGTIQIYRGLAGLDGAFESRPTTLAHAAHTAAITALAAGDVATPASSAVGALGGWPVDGRADVVAAFADGPAVYGWRGQGGMTFDPPAMTGDYGVPGMEGTVALAVDPAGSGDWTGLARGLALAFAETALDGHETVFLKSGFDPPGCGTATGTLLANDAPDVRYAAALACPDPTNPRVLVTVPGRRRLIAPPSLALGSQRAGTAGTATTVQLTAPDTQYDEELEEIFGDVQIGGAHIEGPDAEDFEIARLVTGSCGAPPGVPGVQLTCQPQVRFVPRSPGPKQATLVIESNGYRAAGAAPQSIALTGTGTGAVASAPPALALGDVALGSSASASLTVSNPGNEPLAIDALELEDAGDGWSVALGTCASAVAPDETCSAQVRYEPSATGAVTASLRVRSDGAGAEPVVALSARGVASGVTAAPIALGTVTVGEPHAATATIANSGDDALRIASVAAAGPDAGQVAVDAAACLADEIAPGEHCVLDVTVTPGARGPLDAELRIVSNAPSSPNVVALSATGMQGVVGAPEAVELGSVRIGFFAERQVELENTGDAPLRVGTLATEGPVELVADACSTSTLAIGDGCSVTVRFTPATAGALDARLVVPNDGEGGERTIDLTGTGLPAEEPGGDRSPDGDPDDPAPPAEEPGGGRSPGRDAGDPPPPAEASRSGRSPSGDPGDRTPPPGQGGGGAAGGAPRASAAPALRVTVARRASVRRGGSVRLRIGVRNTGGSTAAAATLKLRLPAALRRLLPQRTTGGSGSPNPVGSPQADTQPGVPARPRPASRPPPRRPRTVTLRLGRLAPGASRILRVTLRVRPGARRGDVRLVVRVGAPRVASAVATSTLRIL